MECQATKPSKKDRRLVHKLGSNFRFSTVRNLSSHFLNSKRNWKNFQVLEFIKKNVQKRSVFSGNMATMAMIYVGTNHTVTNNPHFESVNSQQANTEAYQVYGRQSSQVYWEKLLKDGITHVVVNMHECLRDGFNMFQKYLWRRSNIWTDLKIER